MLPLLDDLVAQSVEHLTFNQGVAGSNPAEVTSKLKRRTLMTAPTAPQLRRTDPRLLEILVCPVTKTPLRYDAERQELISDKASLAFPIREGIPIMLVDEARKL